MNVNEVDISPLARRLAEENNVDWRRLTGSGPEGRVVERDVLDYLARVMAGEEDVDPTPEPLPEGMEAWPEEAATREPRMEAASDDESLLVLDDKETYREVEDDEPIISEDVFLFAAEDEREAQAPDTPPLAMDAPAHQDDHDDHYAQDDEDEPPLFDGETTHAEEPAREGEAHLDFEGWGGTQAEAHAPADEDGERVEAALLESEPEEDEFAWSESETHEDEGAAVAPVFSEEPVADALESDAPLGMAEEAEPSQAEGFVFGGLADDGEAQEGEDEAFEEARPVAAEDAEDDNVPPPVAVASPAAEQARAASALPLVTYGTLLRRYLDLSPLFEAQRAVGRALGDGTPVAPSAFLLRAAAKALREAPFEAGSSVALAVVTEGGVGSRPVADAAELRFSELVAHVETLLSHPPDTLEPAPLVVADMSSFEVDEAVLDLGAPVLILGRILFDSSEGRYRSTLTLSGEVPPAQGAALLARVAELLDAPVQLVL